MVSIILQNIACKYQSHALWNTGHIFDIDPKPHSNNQHCWWAYNRQPNHGSADLQVDQQK